MLTKFVFSASWHPLLNLQIRTFHSIQAAYYLCLCFSDLKSKARRWDEKHVENMKKRRDKFLSELKELAKHRRKEPELQNLRSQIDGLENRLRYSTKDKETTVCLDSFGLISQS